MNKENEESSLQALQNLFANGFDAAWVSSDKVLNATSFEEAINECRYGISRDSDGNINDVYFDGEKLGSDDKILDTIAPFVEKDSYIQMLGEDGSIWRWVFDGENVDEISPKIDWR
jgi:hypothetical protein